MKCTNVVYIIQSEMLLYALNLGFFSLGFAIYPVAYGIGFTLEGLPIVTWISNFKQQTIVGGQYFSVPKPTDRFWVDHIKLTQRFGSCMVKDPPSDWVLQLFVG